MSNDENTTGLDYFGELIEKKRRDRRAQAEAAKGREDLAAQTARELVEAQIEANRKAFNEQGEPSK